MLEAVITKEHFKRISFLKELRKNKMIKNN